MAHHAHHVGALFTADTGGYAVHQHTKGGGFAGQIPQAFQIRAHKAHHAHMILVAFAQKIAYHAKGVFVFGGLGGKALLHQNIQQLKGAAFAAADFFAQLGNAVDIRLACQDLEKCNGFFRRVHNMAPSFSIRKQDAARVRRLVHYNE